MSNRNKLMFFIVMLLGLSEARATSALPDFIEFSSGKKQVRLIELYSSQGCSSCPPAQNWINQFDNNEHLWNHFVPVVFHVDYWDYLGWADPFAKSAYSKRQRSHKWQGNIRSVYTPGFVVDGSEWRGWFRRESLASSHQETGLLIVRVKNEHIIATWTPQNDETIQTQKLNIVQLAMNELTPIRRGENRNKLLKESFIALEHLLVDPKAENENERQIRFETTISIHAKAKAMAFWITEDFSLSPIQATGGWLVTDKKVN